MARRRYVSIKEVAARAGVSFQTASKVLNGGDVRVSGPEVSPELPAGASRWPFRVGDHGPFGLIDAAATVSMPGTTSGGDVSANNVAVTLVNRSPGEEQAEVRLRDYTFTGSAQIRTVTAARPGDARTLPDVETVHLEEDRRTRRAGRSPSGCHPGRSPSSRQR